MKPFRLRSLKTPSASDKATANDAGIASAPAASSAPKTVRSSFPSFSLSPPFALETLGNSRSLCHLGNLTSVGTAAGSSRHAHEEQAPERSDGSAFFRDGRFIRNWRTGG